MSKVKKTLSRWTSYLKQKMYNFLKQNKNVILMAVSLFVVSLTVLMFFLSNQIEVQSDYSANVINTGGEHSTGESETIYHSQLGENIGSMVAVSIDGSINYVSQEIADSYDLTTEDIKADLYFTYIHPEDLPGVMASVGQVFKNESPVSIIGPFRMKIKQSEYKVFIASLYPIISEEQVTQVAVLLRDVTNEINLPDAVLEEADKEISMEEQIEKQTEFLELYNNFKQDIIEEIKTEDSTVEYELPPAPESEIMGSQEDADKHEPPTDETADTIVNEPVDETVTDSLNLPPLPVEEVPENIDTEQKEQGEKDKKIRDEKDKESRLLVQNPINNFNFLSPFWPFLSR